jgi:hypothetical protein
MRLFLPVFAVFALACSGGASPESEVPATVASWRTDEMLVAAVASLPEADRAPVSAWLDAQAALERAGKPTKVVPGMKVGDLPPLAAKAAAEPEAVPDRPLTLEEMMKKAKEGAAAEGAAAEGGAPPPSDRPLTLEEMMKKAKEGVAAEDAAAAAAPPANDAPASP